METRQIGTSQLRVSVVGLGCNNFGFFNDRRQADRCVHAALDSGITFFDMSSEHGAGREETLVGQALGQRRKDVVIATKFGQRELLEVEADGSFRYSDDDSRRGVSRRWIMQSVEESLSRLKTDYIDLYQLHEIDPKVDAEETMRALDDLIAQGKVRAIGLAANAGTVADLTMLQEAARSAGLHSFVSMQAHYNLLQRQAEVDIVPELQKRGMSLLPFWPLANGLLTGKYPQGTNVAADTRLAKIPMIGGMYGDGDWQRVEQLRGVAQEAGMSMVELAFAFLLSSPCVASVIAGASKPEQVIENARAARSRLSAPDKLWRVP